MKAIIIIVLCYIIGSIPFSYLFGRYFGKVDIRSKGSGNIGATNVLRTSGAFLAGASLLADLIKGVLAAWLGMLWGGPALAAGGGVAAVLGHCYPVFLRFRGGKGVSTSAGVILYLLPGVFLVLLTTFILVTFISRYVSLASLSAAIIFPFVTIGVARDWYYIILSLLMGVLVIYRHRANILRLRNGLESKIGSGT